jgi:hypothetical protein
MPPLRVAPHLEGRDMTDYFGTIGHRQDQARQLAALDKLTKAVERLADIVALTTLPQPTLGVPDENDGTVTYPSRVDVYVDRDSQGRPIRAPRKAPDRFPAPGHPGVEMRRVPNRVWCGDQATVAPDDDDSDCPGPHYPVYYRKAYP